MPEDIVDVWLAAWVVEAEDRGVDYGSYYWRAGFDWITAERASRRRPK